MNYNIKKENFKLDIEYAKIKGIFLRIMTRYSNRNLDFVGIVESFFSNRNSKINISITEMYNAILTSKANEIENSAISFTNTKSREQLPTVYFIKNREMYKYNYQNLKKLEKILKELTGKR